MGVARRLVGITQPLSLYGHVAAKSFQRHLAYRAANLAGIATNTFFGAVYIAIYVALFQGQDQVGGLDLRDTVTYAVLSQSLLMVMSAFGNRELSTAIIKGDIVTDLSRPVDFYLYWAAIDTGRAAYYLLLRGAPTFFLGCLLFHPRLPAHPSDALAFGVCLAMGIAVSFTFRFIVNSLAFWTSDARGLVYLASTFILFFAGFIVPLNFFPLGLRRLAEALPFAAMAHLPVHAYLGKISQTELLSELGLLAAWLLGMIFVGRLLLRRMVRRLAIHGG